jgi:hypothetical protein
MEGHCQLIGTEVDSIPDRSELVPLLPQDDMSANKDQYETLVQQLLVAITDEQAFRIAVTTCAEFSSPCVGWRERVEQAIAAQRQELHEDEQRDLAECRQLLSERYAATLVHQ